LNINIRVVREVIMLFVFTFV